MTWGTFFAIPMMVVSASWCVWYALAWVVVMVLGRL